ncbi:type 2a phosphatase activator tip41 [Ophiostoma piceae UAMH 11346]|uniref:Type 2a phosphatase activator tip41 n=1 Tax=Ophiostoma piceae (strain UAMH 11346) TaxID=1262450 RepID=S3D1A5_OPHP1|nr:type 2a phosphatase activator tip41 [Ophiostoma piceae UAMH 11346]
MNNIASPNEPFLGAGSDFELATRTHVQGHWQISSRKLPISRAGAIDAMADRIGIPIPEMIFGDNQVVLRHVPSGWSITFDAADALDKVDKTGESRLQVAYARDWASSREMSSVEGITDVRPYDWSYSTSYRGTEAKGADADGSEKDEKQLNGDAVAEHLEETSEHQLPLELLRQRDPILFNDDVILYESELDDNGISILRVKIRVMPQRLLLLSRFYLRVDNVVVRVRDTRVYVDFATDEVLREYTAREDSFDNVRRALTASRGLRSDGVMVAMRDANIVADLLPVVDAKMERLTLGETGSTATLPSRPAQPTSTTASAAPTTLATSATSASPATSMPAPTGRPAPSSMPAPTGMPAPSRIPRR